MEYLFDFFGGAYVTNLDSRPERLEKFYQEMKKATLSSDYISTKIKRVSAIVPPNKDGNLGCTMTHVSIIKEARALGLKSVLVFEDDAEYIEPETPAIIENIINQLSQREYALFYLGCNTHEKLEQVDKNLFQAKNCLTTHAIAYHSSVYDLIISAFESGKMGIIDVWLRDEVQTKFTCYGSYPPLFSQVSGFSDIQGRMVDTAPFIEKFRKYTEHFK